MALGMGDEDILGREEFWRFRFFVCLVMQVVVVSRRGARNYVWQLALAGCPLPRDTLSWSQTGGEDGLIVLLRCTRDTPSWLLAEYYYHTTISTAAHIEESNGVSSKVAVLYEVQ